MITVNMQTLLITVYVIVHVVFGIAVHRSSLKGIRAYNKTRQGQREPITEYIAFMLFVSRLLFSFPGLLIAIFVTFPIAIVLRILTSIIGRVGDNALSPTKVLSRTLTQIDPKDIAELRGDDQHILLWLTNILAAAMLASIALGIKHGSVAAIVIPVLFSSFMSLAATRSKERSCN